MANRRAKKRPAPRILVELPLAYQDGRDKYSGLMHFLNSRNLRWNVCLVRNELTLPMFSRISSDGIDGAILDCPASDDVLAAINAGSLPCVVIDIGRPQLLAARKRGIAFIDIDSGAIGRRSAEFLLAQGSYSSFGFVGYSGSCRWSSARERRFREALAEKGARCSCFTAPHSHFLDNADALALRAWLFALAKPAALLVACDELAQSVLEICMANDIGVPDNVAVLGVDNDQIVCMHSEPTLSSIQPDFERSGFEAGLLMSQMLADPSMRVRQIVCPVLKIASRQSTAPSTARGKMVIRAEEYIRSHAQDGIGVDDVSRCLRISRRLLDLRFREVTGHTVLDAIQERSLDQVKALLSTTALSIGEIGELCNFRTENYLKRLFRQRFGMTMREYRSRCR